MAKTKGEIISEKLQGNKNAEKWTEEISIKLFEDAIKLTNKKEVFQVGGKEVNGYSFDFIGELARELNTFKEIFTHLKGRFNTLDNLHKTLITNIESNCYYNTKRGLIKEATGIVNLKSNHKWTDRSQTDVTSGDKPILQEPVSIIFK
jgi:hypothetical protein